MAMLSEGVCKYCRKTFAGSNMLRHLKSCAERKKQAGQGDERIFLIRAGNGPFWIYFEVNASSLLSEIDFFLRDIWLECCGHMSAFTIDSVRYFSHTEFMEDDERDMDVEIADVLKPGTKFSHEYDFGTTTELELKCIAERQGDLTVGILLIARNNKLKIACDKCGKPAKQVCSQCVWEGEGFLCNSCAKKHKCGEEMLLPVVNSPRMGMCAYTGEGAYDS